LLACFWSEKDDDYDDNDDHKRKYIVFSCPLGFATTAINGNVVVVDHHHHNNSTR